MAIETWLFLGYECNKCPPGWISHAIGTSEKCLFITKSKIKSSQVDLFCQRLNATVPYPKTYLENQNYRNAFNAINISSSLAVKSCHGIVELNQNGNWNPFPNNKLINVACEKTLLTKPARLRRQTNSGTYI